MNFWMKSSELFTLGVVSMKRQMTISRTRMRVLQIFVLSVKQSLKKPSLWSYSEDHICIMEAGSVIKMGEHNVKSRCVFT